MWKDTPLLYYHQPLKLLVSSGRIERMSILFHKRGKKAVKWVWIVFAAIIAISMIFAYSGGVGAV